MRLEQRLLAPCALLLLAACQAVPTAPMPAPPPPEPVCPEPPPPAPQPDEVKAVVTYVEDVRKAVALSQGRASADQTQAVAQLDLIAASPDAAAEPLKPLAALLSARLAEQRRLQDNVERLTQQLRDSQRRNEQLNEKLEALKAIEQTLPGKPGAPK